MPKHYPRSRSPSKAQPPESGANPISFDTMFAAYERWTDGWFRVQDESLRYCQHVLTRNLDAVTHLASCNDPTEAFELQWHYTSQAIDDYFHESQRMIAMLDAGSSSRRLNEAMKSAGRH
jgi:hypothetical protein